MRILKFSLINDSIATSYNLLLPVGSKVLHFDHQNDVPTIWCACPDTNEVETATFHICYTGHEFPPGKQTYLGLTMIYDRKIVLHLFQEHPESPNA